MIVTRLITMENTTWDAMEETWDGPWTTFISSDLRLRRSTPMLEETKPALSKKKRALTRLLVTIILDQRILLLY